MSVEFREHLPPRTKQKVIKTSSVNLGPLHTHVPTHVEILINMCTQTPHAHILKMK